VIVVDPATGAVSVDGAAARKETMAREVFRHPEFDGCVKLQRVRDYFLCTSVSSPYALDAHRRAVNIESESAYAPERLFTESISVMRQKITGLRKAALALKGGVEEGDVEMADG
jgi:DNA-directed RNA polymerase I and III subunit RPAC1